MIIISMLQALTKKMTFEVFVGEFLYFNPHNFTFKK